MLRRAYTHLIKIYDPERVSFVRVLVTLAVATAWVWALIDHLAD